MDQMFSLGRRVLKRVVRMRRKDRVILLVVQEKQQLGRCGQLKERYHPSSGVEGTRGPPEPREAPMKDSCKYLLDPESKTSQA